jgi:hypothetical protein
MKFWRVDTDTNGDITFVELTSNITHLQTDKLYKVYQQNLKWSPDSNYLAYVDGATASGQLRVYKLVGDVLTEHTSIDNTGLIGYNVNWLQGSKYLVFSYSEPQKPFMVYERDGDTFNVNNTIFPDDYGRYGFGVYAFDPIVSEYVIATIKVPSENVESNRVSLFKWDAVNEKYVYVTGIDIGGYSEQVETVLAIGLSHS